MIHMESISSRDIEALSEIANRLPGKQGNELLSLIASWSICGRKYPRQQYGEPIRFSSEKGKHAGKAIDLSTSGIFIEGPETLEVGEQVGVFLSSPSSFLPVNITGTVVRHTERGIGIRFNYENVEDRDLIDSLMKG